MRVVIKEQNAQRRMRQLSRTLNSVPQRAHTFFKTETPIDSGNARNRTNFINGNTIDANYPYAVRLNEGYSKQARDGMTNPTIRFIRTIVKRIFLFR